MSNFLYYDRESGVTFNCEVEHHKPDPDIPAAGGPYTILYSCNIGNSNVDIYHLLSLKTIQMIEAKAQQEYAGD